MGLEPVAEVPTYRSRVAVTPAVSRTALGVREVAGVAFAVALLAG